MNLNDRLGRLLFIVPYVVHRQGVPLAELAKLLGVTTQQIEADINLLIMVGKPPLTPDHLIDLYIEDDVVYVELDQSLSRPLRLTHEEARAVVLGVKLVGNLGGCGDELEDLLERITQQLNPVDREAVQALSRRVVVQQVSADPFEQATLLRQAIEQHHMVELSYYSASSDQQKIYHLKPLALLGHGGVEYLVALDTTAHDQEKLFRLDRLAALHINQAVFVPPSDLDLEKFRTQRLYFGSNTLQALVRFAPSMAAYVREHFAQELLLEVTDDSLQTHVTTSSAAWLARWILTFGEQAEVLEPESFRLYLRDFCQAAAAAYQQDV